MKKASSIEIYEEIVGKYFKLLELWEENGIFSKEEIALIKTDLETATTASDQIFLELDGAWSQKSWAKRLPKDNLWFPVIAFPMNNNPLESIKKSLEHCL